MDNVVEIANNFTEIPINIWIDIYGIGNHPDRIMADLNQMHQQPNITFKALDSIPAYTTNPLFEKKSVNMKDPHDPLWQQVDLARLYVLRECLTTEEPRGAIYADMDMDISTDTLLKAEYLLDNFGAITGRPSKKFGLENQFFGVAKHQLSFLVNELIVASADSIRDGNNGWAGHIRSFREFQTRLGVRRNDVILKVDSIPDAAKIKESYQLRRKTPKVSHLALS